MRRYREQIGKSLRFKILMRDKFTCVYCGKKSSDKQLHIDHIYPVKFGGENIITNLVTSCIDCNLGKHTKLLNDSSILDLKVDSYKDNEIDLKQIAEWLDRPYTTVKDWMCSNAFRGLFVYRINTDSNKRNYLFPKSEFIKFQFIDKHLRKGFYRQYIGKILLEKGIELVQ